MDIRNSASYLILGALISATIPAVFPVASKRPLGLSMLMHGENPDFFHPGHDWGALKPKLNDAHTATFIQDQAYDPQKLPPERMLMLQNYLAPLILTQKSREAMAIIDCSSDASAKKRAGEMGYQITHSDGRGRAIALKK
ncbi:MAG: hypothetical protein FGM27_08370 [Candidatus Omnitrophica bacterium]|nr:hypothetical protein [Candidatus Omnitrophota bacterium]